MQVQRVLGIKEYWANTQRDNKGIWDYLVKIPSTWGYGDAKLSEFLAIITSFFSGILDTFQKF